jgi:hypothetical protein
MLPTRRTSPDPRVSPYQLTKCDLNFGKNIWRKQDFAGMNIVKILFRLICVIRLSSEPSGFSGLIK